MSKHTPGPWKISFDHSYFVETHEDSEASGSICRVDDGYPKEMAEANARMIAAAPDLLAALKRVASLNLGGDEVEAEVRAAIAKAEGRS